MVATRAAVRSLRPWPRRNSTTQSCGGQKKSRAGEGDFELNFAAKIRTHPPPQAAGTVSAARGSRPDRLLDRRSRCSGAPWSTLSTTCGWSRCSMFPGPQVVNQLEEVLKIVDNHVPEQLIDVPKITSQDVILQRAVLRVPQMTEQVVDVPVPEKVPRHMAGAQQVSSGATLLRGEGSATGGCWALTTSSGPLQWASPPA